MNDLISVIVPVYNGEKFVKECITNITNQTIQNIEIVMVDDGSIDNSRKIIKEMAKANKRIKYFFQKNQGVSVARNKGLQMANGKYIGFVDVDDQLYPDFFEVLINNLVSNKAEISHCGFEVVYPDKVLKFHDTGLLEIQNKKKAISELLSGKNVEPSVCNKLYKKEIIENVRFDNDIKINEDLLFNVKAFMNAKRIVFEDVTKYMYIANSTSVSRSGFKMKNLQDVHIVAKRIRKLIEGEIEQKLIEVFYINKLINILKMLYSQKLLNTNFGKEIIAEIRDIDKKYFDLRLTILKILLLNFPSFYSFAQSINDYLFKSKRKWAN